MPVLYKGFRSTYLPRSVHVRVLHLVRKKKKKIMFLNIASHKQAAERTF